MAQDLCAYVCVFQDCESPDEMFSTTYEWMSHMARYHSELEWRCSICAKAGPRGEAHTEDAYHDPVHLKRHIVESHQAIETTELDLLIQSGARTVGIKQVACPLCRSGLVTLESSDDADTLDDKNGMGLLQLEDDEHIATHIHEFALQAFPSRGGSGSPTGSASSSSHSSFDAKGDITFQSLGVSATARQELMSFHTWQELDETIAEMVGNLSGIRLDFTAALSTLRRRLNRLAHHIRDDYEVHKDGPHVDAFAHRLSDLCNLVLRYQEACSMPEHEQRLIAEIILADSVVFEQTDYLVMESSTEADANDAAAQLEEQQRSSVVQRRAIHSSPFPKVEILVSDPPSDADKLESLVDTRTEALASRIDEARLRWALQLLDQVKILLEAPEYDSKVSELEERHRHYSSEDLLDLQVQAIGIVESLSKQGLPEALYTRSKWLHLGWFGYPFDEKEAQVGYRLAASLGFARANYGLGSLIGDRPFAPMARLEADNYFQIGISFGDAACAYRLGMMLLTGEAHRDQDIPRALHLIKVSADSADRGSPEGAYVYGMLLEGTLPGVVIDDDIYTEILLPDRDMATAYIEEAAYLGSSKAQLKMGEIYIGEGTKRMYNPALSMHYLRLAATRGEAKAALRLSELFLARTSVVAKNDQLAFSYALPAARKGDGHAEFIIGYCFETGAAVGKDLNEARSWYELAVQHGFAPAADRLAALPFTSSPTQEPVQDDAGTQNPSRFPLRTSTSHS